VGEAPGDEPVLNVFTDYHHGDLYFSLQLLFERRLGFALYRPIGLEWFQQGYWKIAEPYGNAADTINQYLAINKLGWNPYKNLNGQHYIEDGVYNVYDPGHGCYQKAITVEKFASMKFDIILPTYEPHEVPFLKLRDTYQPGAKMMAQIGNWHQKSRLPYVIHSAPYAAQPGQRVVYYHQEIDPALFSYSAPDPATRRVYSFVNCLPHAPTYHAYKAALLDVEMKAYGAGSPDGPVSGSAGVASKMREANVGWHLKPFDGFGHTAMGWFAIGRPVVTTMSDVVGSGGDALSLFEPGVTCLNVEAGDLASNCAAIRRMLQPEENLMWSQRVQRRFSDIINYDREAEQIRELIEGVL